MLRAEHYELIMTIAVRKKWNSTHLVPPLKKGVRGILPREHDRSPLENPPQSPFFKGGGHPFRAPSCQLLFVFVSANNVLYRRLGNVLDKDL